MDREIFIKRFYEDEDIVHYIKKNKGYFPIEFSIDLNKKHNDKYNIYKELFNYGWIVAFYDILFALYAWYAIWLDILLAFVAVSLIIPYLVISNILIVNIRALMGLIWVHMITASAIFISYSYSFLYAWKDSHVWLWILSAWLMSIMIAILIKTMILKSKLHLKFSDINKWSN